MNIACYLQNLTSTCRNALDRTSYEMLHDEKPDLSQLRVVGCRYHVHMPKKHQDRKFGPEAKEGIMVCYE